MNQPLPRHSGTRFVKMEMSSYCVTCMNNRLAGILLFSSVVLCIGTTARAQDADSLVQKGQLLRQENGRYIRMAQKDGTLSTREADSLRALCFGTLERPVQSPAAGETGHAGRICESGSA